MTIVRFASHIFRFESEIYKVGGLQALRSKPPHDFQSPKPGFIDIAGQVVKINSAGRRRVVENVTSHECHFRIGDMAIGKRAGDRLPRANHR